MMLLQKPQPAHSPMSFSHRRQTSAPVVVVQPTRIPGLLSLSKPPRSSPPRNQQRHNFKNAPKQALATSATVQIGVRASQPLTPTAQIYTASATPSHQSRGRVQENQPKDKNRRKNRSSSQSSTRAPGSGKHNNSRQPSPPIPSAMTTPHKQNPSQAEVPVNFTNQFDPFLDHSTSTPSPSPRKQPQQSQSKAIPVTTFTHLTPTLARSDPLPILQNRQPRHRQQQRRPVSKRTLTIQAFPICDDMSEIADVGGEPSTPVARRLYGGAPLQSAPISGAPLEFFSPSVPLSSSSPQTKQIGDWSRNHRRTPSEGGIFHMSSDEEVSSGPGGVVLNRNPKVRPLGPFSLPAGLTKETTTPARAGIRAGVVGGSMSTSIDKATFFASSIFQNSPSPEELPDPLLI